MIMEYVPNSGTTSFRLDWVENPVSKSGQFLRRTHVRKTGHFLGNFGTMSGVLNLVNGFVVL